MKKLSLVFCAALLLTTSLLARGPELANPVIGPGPSSSALDSKLRTSLTEIIELEKSPPPPLGLELLIDQIIRQSDLDHQVNELMPWVYSSGDDSVVVDFEEAVEQIEDAGRYLNIAMQRILIKSNDSIGLDPALAIAKLELDEAELTIWYLQELAYQEQ